MSVYSFLELLFYIVSRLEFDCLGLVILFPFLLTYTSSILIPSSIFLSLLGDGLEKDLFPLNSSSSDSYFFKVLSKRFFLFFFFCGGGDFLVL